MCIHFKLTTGRSAIMSYAVPVVDGLVGLLRLTLEHLLGVADAVDGYRWGALLGVAPYLCPPKAAARPSECSKVSLAKPTKPVIAGMASDMAVNLYLLTAQIETRTQIQLKLRNLCNACKPGKWGLTNQFVISLLMLMKRNATEVERRRVDVRIVT